MGSKEDRPCILLVEDDRLTRTVLRHDLKLHGFEVDIAENGDVALKKLQKATKQGKVGYDLVLTDVFMPKVDGEALVRSVTADFRNRLPVAVMSANCAEADKNRLLSSGASEYLVKPIQSESLAQLRRLVPSKVAKDTQESQPSPKSEPKNHAAILPDQAALCSSLLEAAHQAMSQYSFNASLNPTAEPDSNKEATMPSTAQPAPAEHSTGSDVTGMQGPETQGQPQTVSPSTHNAAAQAAADAAQGSSAYDTCVSPSILSPLQVTGGVSRSPLLNVAVVMPPGTAPPAADQASAAGAPGPATDAQDALATSRQHVVNTSSGSAFCAQIVPAQVTFISSSANMAPIATRKAALVRFREKKARSHFAPKVRYHERKKLAEARPRYKGQFVKLEQLPKEQQQAIARAKAAAAAGSRENEKAWGVVVSGGGRGGLCWKALTENYGVMGFVTW